MSLAAEFAELFERPLMRFGSAVGQQVFGKELPRKRRGASRERLRGGRTFAGHGAARIFANIDREKGLAVGAIEEINQTLLRGLRDGIHVFAIALDGNERGRGREVAIPKIMMDSLKMPDSLARFRV